MISDEIIALTAAHQMGTYSRYPVVFVRGEGTRLFDAEGREYLDFLGGIAVVLLGHSHPDVWRAVSMQAKNLVHVSNLFHVPVQSQLGKVLSEATIGGKVFFCNSGTEANEAAIKLARKWASDGGKAEAHEIVVVEGAFHGRTYGGLSATQPRYHKGFEPMVPGFVTVPFGDLAALEGALTEKTCAFLIEPIQGESGIRMHPPGYLKEAERLCRQNRVLFIVDEIQTGLGRTGAMMACTRFDVKPDVITFAKGLANGLPLGAVVAREEVAAAFGPGTHGSTFGGNPVCCAASRVVLDTVSSPGFLEGVLLKGEILRDGLTEIAAFRPGERRVRGLGLMLALDTEVEARSVTERCLSLGLVVGTAGGNVLRFLPPLTITEGEIRQGLAILRKALAEGGRE